MVGIGGLFVLAGVKGFNVLQMAQNLVTGKPANMGVSVAPLADSTYQAASQAATIVGGNKGIGQQLASGYGWGSGNEWDALDKLWTQESTWDNHAENSSSGAYGIPQALPYSKMPKAAWPERYGGQSDANTQIQWGLSYIKGRYGDPVAAWAHEQSNGWY